MEAITYDCLSKVLSPWTFHCKINKDGDCDSGDARRVVDDSETLWELWVGRRDLRRLIVDVKSGIFVGAWDAGPSGLVAILSLFGPLGLVLVVSPLGDCFRCCPCEVGLRIVLSEVL